MLDCAHADGRADAQIVTVGRGNSFARGSRGPNGYGNRLPQPGVQGCDVKRAKKRLTRARIRVIIFVVTDYVVA